MTWLRGNIRMTGERGCLNNASPCDDNWDWVSGKEREGLYSSLKKKKIKMYHSQSDLKILMFAAKSKKSFQDSIAPYLVTELRDGLVIIT